MKRRRAKQLTYGTMYVVAAMIFAYLVLAPLVGPISTPKVTPVPTSPYSDIVVEAVDVIPHKIGALNSDQEVDIVARLRNPNANVGVANYTLTFDITDTEGNKITSRSETTYILPGSIQYMMVLSVSLGQKTIGNVEVQKPADVAFIPVSNNVPIPNFSSFARERSVKMIANNNVEEQKGIIGNTGTVNWERVEVYGVALDSSGAVVGAGKTFLGALRVGEQREFTMQWPQPQSPTNRVIIFPSTNIFSESNSSKIIGDPALLR